ncbi:MAG: hypothetical protein K6D02_10050 [Lachnospiraceae bacterium]|nr:hypothetical protein [Lachnospiraceae bacterium]
MNVFYKSKSNGELPTNSLNEYVLSYKKSEPIFSRRKLYVEKYNEQGTDLLRLRDKKTDKEVVFWTSKNDVNASTMNNKIKEFLLKIQSTNNREFFEREGKDYVIAKGLFGFEDNNTIEIIAYYSDLFINDVIR